MQYCKYASKKVTFMTRLRFIAWGFHDASTVVLKYNFKNNYFMMEK